MITDNTKNKKIVEALILAAEQPLSVERLYKIFAQNNNVLELDELKNIINELTNDYSEKCIELKEVSSGWRFQVRAEMKDWIAKLYEERPPRYSRAFMEILALVAYRQPITRAEIEEIRGVVVSSNIIKTLIEHEWVKVVGYKEVPGRPALLATTKKFLDHFNLKHLDELPPLIEFTDKIVNDSLDAAMPESSDDNEYEIAISEEQESSHIIDTEE